MKVFFISSTIAIGLLVIRNTFITTSVVEKIKKDKRELSILKIEKDNFKIENCKCEYKALNKKWLGCDSCGRSINK